MQQFGASNLMSTPPTPVTLKGADKWAQLGMAKLKDHITRSNLDFGAKDITELTHKSLEALQSSPQGKSFLIQASDLKPGSAAMKNLVNTISATMPSLAGGGA